MRHEPGLLALDDAIPIHDMACPTHSDFPGMNHPPLVNMLTVSVLISAHRAIDHDDQIVRARLFKDAHVRVPACSRR